MLVPESPFLDTRAAAKFLGLDGSGNPLISPGSLERWRSLGTGPQFIKAGRRVLYRREDLLAWAESKLRRSTADEGEGEAA